jgi:hypothetical protein
VSYAKLKLLAKQAIAMGFDQVQVEAAILQHSDAINNIDQLLDVLVSSNVSPRNAAAAGGAAPQVSPALPPLSPAAAHVLSPAAAGRVAADAPSTVAATVQRTNANHPTTVFAHPLPPATDGTAVVVATAAARDGGDSGGIARPNLRKESEEEEKNKKKDSVGNSSSASSSSSSFSLGHGDKFATGSHPELYAFVPPPPSAPVILLPSPREIASHQAQAPTFAVPPAVQQCSHPRDL